MPDPTGKIKNQAGGLPGQKLAGKPLVITFPWPVTFSVRYTRRIRVNAREYVPLALETVDPDYYEGVDQPPLLVDQAYEPVDDIWGWHRREYESTPDVYNQQDWNYAQSWNGTLEYSLRSSYRVLRSNSTEVAYLDGFDVGDGDPIDANALIDRKSKRADGLFFIYTFQSRFFPSATLQSFYGYTVRYPYPDVSYPEVVWTYRLPVTTAVGLVYGDGWTVGSGHPFTSIAAGMDLIHLAENVRDPGAWKTVTAIFRRVPTMATQNNWNASDQRMIRPACIIRTRSYDIIPGSGDDATDSLAGTLTISDNTYPTQTWLRRRVIRAVVSSAPATWTATKGLFYRFPANFGTKKREKRRYALATTTYSYDTSAPTPDAPTTFSGNIPDLLYQIATECQDVIMNGDSTAEERLVAQNIMANARLQLGPWAIENCVHAGLTYTVTGPVMAGSVSVLASDPSSVPGTIIISDEVLPWRGGIFVRIRTTIPGA